MFCNILAPHRYCSWPAVDLIVHPCFDRDTFTWSYVLAHPATGRCAIIDPVLGFDPDTGRVDTRGADRILELVDANGYCVEWILDTHVHVDHLTAARYLKSHLVCAQTGIGEHVRQVQSHFAAQLGMSIATDGRQFDRLLQDGERICVGRACGRVMHTPGHSPACVSYVFERFAFVGDTVFMPDHGTARCDFPGGDAKRLFRSVQKLYALPGETRMMLCHDYGGTDAAARDYRCSVTVAEQRRSNVMLRPDTPISDFLGARAARDRQLDAPRLLEPALRANLEGGWPPPSADSPTAASASARAVA